MQGQEIGFLSRNAIGGNVHICHSISRTEQEKCNGKCCVVCCLNIFNSEAHRCLTLLYCRQLAP